MSMNIEFGETSASGQPESVVSKIGGTLFLMVFLAAGTAFTAFLLHDVWKTVRTYRWPGVECTIQQSRVERLEKKTHPYWFVARYSYRVGDREHTSQQVGHRYAGSDDYAEANRLALKYPADSRAICYVNPNDPADAILRRGAFWHLFGIVIPLVFVAIGGGGIWLTWASKSGPQKQARPSSTLQRKGRIALAGFASLFLMAGVGFFISLFVLPAVRIAMARGWTATPCTVISSMVRSHAGDESTTYSVDILYAYRVGGQEYRSNRYGFMTSSTAGEQGKQAVVNRYRPRSKTICYVNPADPTDAVLNKGITADLWWGLMPLIFVAVGGGGMYFSLRSGRGRLKGSQAMWLPKVKGAAADAARGQAGPVVLKSTSPFMKLLGTLAVAAIWNGIVSVFIIDMISGWRRGKPDMCLTAFLIPFELVGLVMLGAVVYYALACLNPRVKLAVSSARIRLGETISLGWQFSGRYERITKLSITLEGREKATYQRGTNTTTDTHVFAKIPLFSADTPEQIGQGKAAVVVPTDTMHSFEARNNKIEWVVKVQGEIPRWPDVKDEYAIVVLPADMPKEAAV